MNSENAMFKIAEHFDDLRTCVVTGSEQFVRYATMDIILGFVQCLFLLLIFIAVVGKK